jgi:RimJ/RimL family protein N-acetyltransferase
VIKALTADGKTITVRIATEADAENLLNLKKSYIKGSSTIPLQEHEYTNSIKEEAALIERYNRLKNSLLVVAECDGRLIGNLDLTGNQREKLFHTAMLGMGIAYNWQNRKIGRLLMENALRWAADDSPLEIIWLEVYASNLPGRKLYENSGFEECGVIKNFFRDVVIADKITMVKYLDNA